MPALRVTTRLVQVSVVVHDKHDEPITGLTKGDFVLLDDKKPQAIQIFSMQTNQVPVHSPASLPPDTYTNRFQERSDAPPSVTMVLLDGLNTRFEDQRFARQQVVKFLQQIQPQDRVALYTLGREVRVLHDFTSDAERLLAALDKFKGRTNAEVDASEPNQPVDLSDAPGDTAALEDLLNNVAQRDANFQIQDRVRITVDGLVAIADHVASLPGRKNLVWVSGSFPFSIGYDNMDLSSTNDMIKFADDIERAARALNDANLAVYPVDARGLLTVFSRGGNASRAKVPRPVGMNNTKNVSKPGARGPMSSPDPLLFDTMNVLADRTGGKAYYNTNDIYGAIRRAVDDSRVTYTLGYYPEDIAWDGSFHEIKVEVKQPGAQVRARKGYFAIREPSPSTQNVQAAIAQAAASPLDATEIGIRAEVHPVNVLGAQGLNVEIGFDLHQIRMEEKNGRWTGALDAGLVVLDSQDQILKGTQYAMQLSLPLARYQDLLKEGVVYKREIPLLPNATQVRVVLRDASSGSIGSVSIPLLKYLPRANSAN
jgi:VWFA-related protein